ncbi:MAG: barstar family protein [Paludibacteraceae bacterium]|nr:barstar family protein [Paludibacteraceae bacterium]
MIYNTNKKELASKLVEYNSNNTKLITIDYSIKDADLLFKKLFDELSFPDYFGFNWNALDDCLQDFSWLKEDFVVFVIQNKNNVLINETYEQKELFFKCLKLASDFWDDPNDEFGYKELHPNLIFNVYYVDD